MDRIHVKRDFRVTSFFDKNALVLNRSHSPAGTIGDLNLPSITLRRRFRKRYRYDGDSMVPLFSFLERYRQRRRNLAVARRTGKLTHQLSRHVYARRSPLVIGTDQDDPGAIFIRQVVGKTPINSHISFKARSLMRSLNSTLHRFFSLKRRSSP